MLVVELVEVKPVLFPHCLAERRDRHLVEKAGPALKYR
jgi:hypothetical protein